MITEFDRYEMSRVVARFNPARTRRIGELLKRDPPSPECVALLDQHDADVREAFVRMESLAERGEMLAKQFGVTP